MVSCRRLKTSVRMRESAQCFDAKPAIGVRTVEVHRARVFEKMDVKSAVELANV